MTTRTISLLNSGLTSAIVSPWISPEIASRDMLDATVMVIAENVTGGPATATMSPVFQNWFSILGGNQDESYTGGAGTDPTNSWFNLGAAANPNILPDGDWTAAVSVAGAAIATPVLVGIKTIRGGFPWRVSVAYSLIGGTAPVIRVSVIAYIRERAGMAIPDPSVGRPTDSVGLYPIAVPYYD